jgi:hypothetical protein
MNIFEKHHILLKLGQDVRFFFCMKTQVVGNNKLPFIHSLQVKCHQACRIAEEV